MSPVHIVDNIAHLVLMMKNLKQKINEKSTCIIT
jgi:hypothetical protein